jgi:hypothetical protein
MLGYCPVLYDLSKVILSATPGTILFKQVLTMAGIISVQGNVHT